MKKTLLLTILIFLFTTSCVMAATVTVRWIRNTESDLAGYRTMTQGDYGWTPGTDPRGPSVVGTGNLIAIIKVLDPAFSDQAQHPAEYTFEVTQEGVHWVVLTAFDIPLTGLDSVTPVEITDIRYNESGFSNDPELRIDNTPPAPPGGFDIWEIIIAVWNWLKSWFAA